MTKSFSESEKIDSFFFYFFIIDFNRQVYWIINDTRIIYEMKKKIFDEYYIMIRDVSCHYLWKIIDFFINLSFCILRVRYIRSTIIFSSISEIEMMMISLIWYRSSFLIRISMIALDMIVHHFVRASKIEDDLSFFDFSKDKREELIA